MPGKRGFTSRKQWKYMFKRHPKIAQKMAKETRRSFKSLPKYAKKGRRKRR